VLKFVCAGTLALALDAMMCRNFGLGQAGFIGARSSLPSIELEGRRIFGKQPSRRKEPVMTGKSYFADIFYPMLVMLVAACAWLPLAATPVDAANLKTFLPKYHVSSTNPENGDLNPYGIAFVPTGFPSGGVIGQGDVLVSNFNDSNNCQGQGTTIVQFNPNNATDSVAPPGTATTFFSSSQVGLSTALGVLKGGFVIVGNVPSGPESEGCSSVPSPGVLQIIDRNGNLVTTLTDSSPGGTIFGSPWDLTVANDKGGTAQVFVSNVLTGTVGRLDLAVGPSTVTIQHSFVVAQGYTFGTDPAAFVLGPTGLALDASANLFVASTADNKIYKVPNASKPLPPPATTGTVVFADPHLRGPLALVFSPIGTLLTANGDAVNGDPAHPSEIVEFTPTGLFIREFNLEATQGGAFGLAPATTVGLPLVFNFAAVDDITNSVLVNSLPVP
jgi:hypothetical protein